MLCFGGFWGLVGFCGGVRVGLRTSGATVRCRLWLLLFCFFRLFCEACEFVAYLLPGPAVVVRDVYVVFRGELVAVGVGVVTVAVMVGVEAGRCFLVVGDSAVHVDCGVGLGVCLESRVVCGEVDVAVDAVGVDL